MSKDGPPRDRGHVVDPGILGGESIAEIFPEDAESFKDRERCSVSEGVDRFHAPEDLAHDIERVVVEEHVELQSVPHVHNGGRDHLLVCSFCEYNGYYILYVRDGYYIFHAGENREYLPGNLLLILIGGFLAVGFPIPVFPNGSGVLYPSFLKVRFTLAPPAFSTCAH